MSLVQHRVREQYPLDFHLWDAAQQPVLSSLALDGQSLTLGIYNTSGGDINLKAPPDDRAYHFILRFRKGTLSNVENIRVAGPDPAWVKVGPVGSTATHDVQELYLRGPAGHIIGAGKERIIRLDNVQADTSQGTRTTRVELLYRNLDRAGRLLEGHRQKTLSVINQQLPQRPAVHPLPLHVGFAGANTILNDGESKSTLTVQLTNVDPDQELHFPTGAKIILNFDVGDSDQRAWGLATLEELKAIDDTTLRHVGGHGQTEIEFEQHSPSGQNVLLQWEFTPPDDFKLGPGNALTLTIRGIRSSLPAGPTNLYLHCKDVAGYPDRRYTLVVLKSPLIFSDGRVGIGTTNPASDLDFAGSVRILSNTNPILFSSAWTRFPDKVGEHAEDDKEARKRAEISNDTDVFKSLMIVGNRSADESVRRVSVWDRLEVTGDLAVRGRLGIGTEAPQTTLEIRSGADAGPSLRLTGKGGQGAKVGIDFATYDPTEFDTTTAGARIEAVDANYSAALDFQTKKPGAADAGLVSRLYIQNDGNVGIGTTTPSETLTLESPANTEQVGILLRSTDGGRNKYDAMRILGGWHGTNSSAWGEQRLSIQGYNGNNWKEVMTIKADGNVGVDGNLRVVGKVSSGRDIVITGGNTAPGGKWDIHEVDLTRFANSTRGFKIWLYGQRNHPGYDVWNWEGHITFEQSGFVSNPDFGVKYRWGVIRWTVSGQVQFRLGHPTKPTKSNVNCLLGESVINVYTYDPADLNGEPWKYWPRPYPVLWFAFHPDWRGRVIITDV